MQQDFTAKSGSPTPAAHAPHVHAHAHAHRPARKAERLGPSLLASSALNRLAGAAVLVLLLWGVVAWALNGNAA